MFHCRVRSRVALIAVKAIALAMAFAAAVRPASAYDTQISSATLNAAKPGTILRVWSLPGGAPAGSKAYRILYRSTDFNDRPVAVSGAVITKAYVSSLCRGGARVKMYTMPGVGHVWAGRDGANAAVEWIGRRFKGEKAPNDC